MDKETLTSGTGSGTVPITFSEAGYQVDPGVIALTPVLKGQPVLLRITDSSIRMPRGRSSLDLHIVPLSVYGTPSSKVLVALDTKGSRVFDKLSDIKASDLYRVGLGWRLSKAIADMLLHLFTLRSRHGY